MLDLTVDEDGSRIRLRNATKNMAIVRKFALNKLQLVRTRDVSIKGLRKATDWSNAILEHCISSKIIMRQP